MKDVVQISFSVKVEASPLAKGLTEPFVKLLEKSMPLIERVANAAVASFEKEASEKMCDGNTSYDKGERKKDKKEDL